MQPLISDDERLAQILSDVTDRIRRGESPELQALLQQHPDLAAELKEIWPALALAEEFAKPSLDHEKQAPATPQPDPSRALVQPSLAGGEWEWFTRRGKKVSTAWWRSR